MKHVWVLTISHRHGTDCSVFTKRQKAVDFLYEYVKQWWDDEIPNKKIPSTMGRAVDAYFDHVGDRSVSEWYNIIQTVVDPK